MKWNLAAKNALSPFQSLIVSRSQSVGLSRCGAWTWCHVIAALMSRMYLTANAERMSAWFLFCLFCVHYNVGPTSSKQTGSEQLLSMKPFFLMCQIRRPWSLRWTLMLGGRCTAMHISYSVKKKKTSLAYALGKFLFIMPFFVQVDSLEDDEEKPSLACMFVEQHNLCDVHL